MFTMSFVRLMYFYLFVVNIVQQIVSKERNIKLLFFKSFINKLIRLIHWALTEMQKVQRELGVSLHEQQLLKHVTGEKTKAKLANFPFFRVPGLVSGKTTEDLNTTHCTNSLPTM